jgi:hypothetical protein
MKISGMVQAVILLLLLASAASCEVNQVYFKKVFTPATNKSPEVKTVKFLNIDTVASNENNETSVKIISSDTISKKVNPELTKTEGIRTKRVRQNTF